MPISTTVGGLENIVLVRLAFHQVVTTHTHTKKNADHQKIVCFMTGWEFRHWNVIANGNQSKLQGNEGGRKEGKKRRCLWSYWKPIPDLGDTVSEYLSHRKGEKETTDGGAWANGSGMIAFLLHRVKKGNSGKLQMVAGFCNNSAKSLSSMCGKNLLLFVDFIVPPKLRL